MDRVGLVGLPNSGKSSLFNSLTGGDAVVASHPFSTVETEVGVAHVPDPRVDALGRMSQSRKIVYAGFDYNQCLQTLGTLLAKEKTGK